MATVRIQVNGDLGAITLRAFLTFAENALAMLKDYDSAISGEPKGSLEWVVTNLTTGSLCAEIDSRSRFEDKNFGPDVTTMFVNGWSLIEGKGETPPLLSQQGMARAKNIVRLIGREGTTGFEVSNVFEKTEVSARSAANIDKLVKVRFRSIGSVEGRIETVSIHGPARFIIYHSRTRKAVTCRVPKDRLAEMLPKTETMGHRVSVVGLIHSNAKGEPLRVDAQRIRIFRSDQELPTWESLSGSDPDFTGEFTTAEYVRRVRGG